MRIDFSPSPDFNRKEAEKTKKAGATRQEEQ